MIKYVPANNVLWTVPPRSPSRETEGRWIAIGGVHSNAQLRHVSSFNYYIAPINTFLVCLIA